MAQTYSEQFENAVDQGQGTVADLKDQAAESVTNAKDKIQEAGRNVQGKIDETRTPAADKLQSAASALHEKAGSLPGGETVAGLAHGAADRMQATADYVRDHDVQRMMADVETLVRKRPGQSLLAAAAVGFLIGRALRNND
jgi:ElaB/YqjD/DUF883 family membrane-anchored ribosome-binding protein